MTATPDKYPQGYFKLKPCRECGENFQPVAPSHLYCSEACSSLGFSRNYLRKSYGLSYEEYMNMFEDQDHKCLICFSEGFKLNPKSKMDLVVDHDHATGKVRGLLCHNCNRALGLLQDSLPAIKNALLYLEGATTIPIGSTSQAIGDGSAQPTAEGGDDIVWSSWRHEAGEIPDQE